MQRYKYRAKWYESSLFLFCFVQSEAISRGWLDVASGNGVVSKETLEKKQSRSTRSQN